MCVFYLFQSDVKFTNFGVPLLKRFEPSHIKTVQSSVAAYKWCWSKAQAIAIIAPHPFAVFMISRTNRKSQLLHNLNIQMIEPFF